MPPRFVRFLLCGAILAVLVAQPAAAQESPDPEGGFWDHAKQLIVALRVLSHGEALPVGPSDGTATVGDMGAFRQVTAAAKAAADKAGEYRRAADGEPDLDQADELAALAQKEADKADEAAHLAVATGQRVGEHPFGAILGWAEEAATLVEEALDHAGEAQEQADEAAAGVEQRRQARPAALLEELKARVQTISTSADFISDDSLWERPLAEDVEIGMKMWQFWRGRLPELDFAGQAAMETLNNPSASREDKNLARRYLEDQLGIRLPYDPTVAEDAARHVRYADGMQTHVRDAEEQGTSLAEQIAGDPHATEQHQPAADLLGELKRQVRRFKRNLTRALRPGTQKPATTEATDDSAAPPHADEPAAPDAEPPPQPTEAQQSEQPADGDAKRPVQSQASLGLTADGDPEQIGVDAVTGAIGIVPDLTGTGDNDGDGQQQPGLDANVNSGSALDPNGVPLPGGGGAGGGSGPGTFDIKALCDRDPALCTQFDQGSQGPEDLGLDTYPQSDTPGWVPDPPSGEDTHGRKPDLDPRLSGSDTPGRGVGLDAPDVKLPPGRLCIEHPEECLGTGSGTTMAQSAEPKTSALVDATGGHPDLYAGYQPPVGIQGQRTGAGVTIVQDVPGSSAPEQALAEQFDAALSQPAAGQGGGLTFSPVGGSLFGLPTTGGQQGTTWPAPVGGRADAEMDLKDLFGEGAGRGYGGATVTPDKARHG